MNVALPLFLAASLAAKVNFVEKHYDRIESKQLVPMLTEVIKFPTYAGQDEAIKDQQQWLLATAARLGFVARDAGKVTEIELPGPEGAPILGLMVHGDVQPVDADAWSFPPFAAKVENGYVYGRGAADDKGPLVQALLAMHALKESGLARTHTIRLLVGSDEESGSTDVSEYLKTHAAPDYTLVLDSAFPLIVGEKAWNSLTVTTTLAERDASTPYEVSALKAGLAASIVPDSAEIDLHWRGARADWEPVIAALSKFKLPSGTRLVTKIDEDTLRVVTYGKSAHAGVNLEGGRNALVALAKLMEGRLPAGGANDLLTFARTAGQDIYGTGLGFTRSDPLWGRYAVNVATIKPDADDAKKQTLTINIRSTPPKSGEELEADLARFVADFDARTGASFTTGGYYKDKVLAFDPQSRLVKRLLADYAAATGEKSPKPAISGGGTYAKRLPNAIAVGMWFPDKPYPGHDVDEKNPIADLHKGTRVLIRMLVDIATGGKIENAFAR